MVSSQSSFRVMDGLTVSTSLKTGQRFRLPSGRVVEVLSTYPEAAQIVASCGYVRTGALRPSNKGAGRVSLTQHFLAAHAQPAH